MKKLILFELIILFLATTFESDSPPGWFQQTLPVNDFVNDIFFLDSLTGWIVTDGEDSPPDTGYVMKTTNGGNNWNVQYFIIDAIKSVYFTDQNIGYIAGGTGGTKLFKTTNGGSSWFNINFKPLGRYEDLFFLNKDTGWVTDANNIDGGLFNTTNGGVNWSQQLNNTFRPLKVFFINKDTGWVGTNDANGRLFKTTDGGGNWNLQFTTTTPVEAVFFLNGFNGWLRGGTGNGCMYTTNGGFTWLATQGEVAGYDVKFVNDSIGYSGGSFMKVTKSTDGGKNWGYQNSPIFTALQTAIFKGDTMRGWMGTNGIIKTTDGGGPITYTGIQQISNEVPSEYKLFQNYPNPFNPATNIKYQIVNTKYVKLMVFDIQGKEVTTLVDQKQYAGTYEADWNANDYPSGVYFYSLIVDGITVETRKMILLK